MKNTKRSFNQELLDLGPSYYTQEEYEDCLKQLSRIGRFLGGNKATLQTFSKLPKPHTILEVGCGGGEFALQLAKQFPQAHVVGIDISSDAIAFAKKRLQETSLKNVRFDVSSSTLPFPPNSFDVVTSTLVCHHLTDEQLIEFLKNSYQIAKIGMIINDLHRHWLASWGFALIARIFFRNRLIMHDGLLSIKRAFKRQDWIDYLQAAEIPLEHCSITWHWAFRWVISIDTTSKKSKI
jgi:2-polyprenyl-3-methyl-5-hydroxy-6-metoxy-1,4-benzoquinol methylase